MKKVLVADQEEALCLLYNEELTEEGYDVVMISDPKEVMQAVEDASPHLILLDIRMNEDDSGILLRDIRSSAGDIPVILCTTYSPSKPSLEYWGVDDIVMKSSNFRDLKAKIHRLLGNEEKYVSPGTGPEYARG